MPKVSVIIATYNRAVHLSETLSTLLKQNYQDFEILVVDDGSTDSTKEIMESYLKKYPHKAKYLYQKNSGPSVARNKGIKEAKGDIVIFLDDDAIAAPNFVKKHLEAYRDNHILGARGKILKKNTSIYNYFQSHYDLGEDILPSLISTEGNCSFRRPVLLEVKGFKVGKFGREGDELTGRILQAYVDNTRLIYYPAAIIYHNYADTFWGLISKTYRYGREKGREIARKQLSISLLFPRNEIKDLFVPSLIYWWRIYRRETEIGFADYLWGIFTSTVYMWVKKTAEILGYFGYRQRRESEH